MSRNFAIPASVLKNEIPLLPKDIYTGVMEGCAIQGKEKCYLSIKEEELWDKALKQYVKTGRIVVAGFFLMGVRLTDTKAIKILGRDEPKFHRMVNLNIDYETLTLSPDKNVLLRKFMDTLGLTELELENQVDWEYDNDVEIPVLLRDNEKAIDMVNSLHYHVALLDLICNSANGIPVNVSIIVNTDKKTGTKSNSIDSGQIDTPFIGILPV
jgi:hypothetical protein